MLHTWWCTLFLQHGILMSSIDGELVQQKQISILPPTKFSATDTRRTSSQVISIWFHLSVAILCILLVAYANWTSSMKIRWYNFMIFKHAMGLQLNPSVWWIKWPLSSLHLWELKWRVYLDTCDVARLRWLRTPTSSSLIVTQTSVA